MSNLVRTFKPQAKNFDESIKQLYFSLAADEVGDAARDQAKEYLQDQLSQARTLRNELPERLSDLAPWMHERAAAVGEEYRQYLSVRKGGAPRRFFTNRSHALHFLQAVAPTKLVDGAWLYGLLPRWKDLDYLPLIRTYLEELGDGIAEKNHVVLYKKLLTTHGCEQWRDLDEEHFIQGAIQLCLAHEADQFLPEVIGYNLGYEQLPLHLLITAYELNELGIDPYYFTLHITIDNAATGHAHKALASLQQLQPLVGDAELFYRRVADGYRLNDLGANTMSVIRSFDLEKEVIDVFREKSMVGKNMHSDYCRVGGRTVNDWLSDAEQIPAFLKALEDAGWIVRGEPAEHSRFWRLIQGEHAEMFGVFNEYEQQLLRDWIALPVSSEKGRIPDAGATASRAPSFRMQQRQVAAAKRSGDSKRVQYIGTARSIFRKTHEHEGVDDFTSELRLFEQKLSSLNSEDAVMRTLINMMSPAHHHTKVGLMATRMFSKLIA